MNFHYVNSNVEKGRTFMWMFSMQSTSDDFGHAYGSESHDLDRRRDLYAELLLHAGQSDGYWNLRTHLSYGFPIGFLKSNFNVMAGVTYTKTPSMLGGTVDAATGAIVGGERNDASNIGYDFGAVWAAISPRMSILLSPGTAPTTRPRTRWNATKAKNRYFNHRAQGDVKIVFPLGFTLTASAAYTQYIGFTNDYDSHYLLCNAYIGKKVFRNQQGEIMFGVNDMFNQNKAFARTTGSGWTQNATNSVIGRYYMVQFTYNLRHFGKKGLDEYQGLRRHGPVGFAPPHGSWRPGRTSPPWPPSVRDRST